MSQQYPIWNDVEACIYKSNKSYGAKDTTKTMENLKQSLNKKQLEVYNKVLTGSDKAIVLLGSAGTGKTHTTSAIVNDWKGSVALTSTSNKAAEVLSIMSNKEATTIHKQLGYRLISIGFNQVLHQKTESKVADLVIVEEISMLPKKLYYHLMHLLDEGHIQKVLFLGDPLQLPAVSGGIDIKDIKGTTIELVQPMRQDPSKTELMYYLQSLRTAIETKDIDFNPMPNNEDIVIVESHKEFCKEYLKCDTNKKILAHRNSIVDKYNMHINKGIKFNEGDEVIIDKPLGTHSNGDMVIITEIEEDLDKYILTVTTTSGSIHTIYNYKSKSHFESLLDNFKQIEDEEGYWDLANSNYNLKHVYASTIYKAQGSTYDTVFIDGSDLVYAYTVAKTQYTNPISYDLFLRLLYVAISRMKSKCYLYLGDKREYKYLQKGI